MEYLTVKETAEKWNLSDRMVQQFCVQGRIPGAQKLITSKLQTMRKEAGFNVTDHIEVYCQGSEKVAQVLRENQQSILHDVLGEACHFDILEGYTAQQDVNGETVTFGVKRV